MFDSVTVSSLRGVASTSGEAVAGYIDGRYRTYSELAAAYPHDHHLSVAVTAGDDADCLDVETGDAAPAQAPGWVRRQLARGIWRPCLYCNLATLPDLERAMSQSGIARESVRVWVAHFTGQPHIEPGCDATQWTDHSHGRNLDESLCLDTFFPSPLRVPRGIAGFNGTIDLVKGEWKAHGTPGIGVVLGGPDEWWNAKLAVNRRTGQWRISPLPAQ